MKQPDLCSACSAPILWLAHDISGQPAPIDATAAENGNVLPIGNGKYRIADKREREELGPRGLLRTNHFQTCPQSAMFRRSR